MNDYLLKIEQTLNKLFEAYQKDTSNPAVLLSGGIDSSIISYLVKKHFSNFTLLSFGSQKSNDFSYIQTMSNYLGKQSVWVEIAEDDINKNINLVKTIMETSGVEQNLTHLSLALGYFLVFTKAQELKINCIFTGQGPDILLGGYHRYKDKTPAEVKTMIEGDLPLLTIDGKRDSSMAQHFNIALVNPYLENEFTKLSLEIPVEYKIKNGIEKYILRQYGKGLGLPEEIVNRPKNAFQYSTGIQKLVEKSLQSDTIR